MNENIEQNVANNTRDIAVLLERDRSFDQRLGVVEKVADVTYELVSNMKELTIEVKHLGESLEKSTASAESREKERDERIYDMIKELAEKTEGRFTDQGKRLGDIEKKPGKKWDDITTKILVIVVTAVVTFALGRIGL